VNIVVVGCGNVGFETVRLMAREHSIFVIDATRPPHLEPLLQSFPEIHLAVCDGSQPEQLRGVVDDFAREFDRIDGFVCTVGTLNSATPSSDWAAYRACVEVNVLANVSPIAAFEGRFARGARVIVLSSTSGQVARPALDAYTPAKWALEAACRSLRRSLGTRRATLDVICPENFQNRYSTVFGHNGHVRLQPEEVAAMVAKLLVHPQNKTHFMPLLARRTRILERLAPWAYDARCGIGLPTRRRRSYMKLAVRNVLLTGAGSDLGREIAKAYARRVEKLCIVDSSGEVLEELKREIEGSTNCRVLASNTDLCDEAAIRGYAAGLPRIDLMINEVGWRDACSLEAFGGRDYRDALWSGFFAVVLLTTVLWERTARPNKLVNVLPADVLLGMGVDGPSAAARSALWAYTRSLRRLIGNQVQVSEVLVSAREPGAPRGANAWTESRRRAHSRGTSPNRLARQILRSEVDGDEYVMIPRRQMARFLVDGIAPGFLQRARA